MGWIGLRIRDPHKWDLEKLVGPGMRAIGMVDDVAIRIHDEFVYTDFFIFPAPVDNYGWIILGRPFLKDVGATIDYETGNMTLQKVVNNAEPEDDPGQQPDNPLMPRERPMIAGAIRIERSMDQDQLPHLGHLIQEYRRALELRIEVGNNRYADMLRLNWNLEHQMRKEREEHRAEMKELEERLRS